MKQLVSGSLDNCVMVWNFKPQLRAYRFAGHKVRCRVYMLADCTGLELQRLAASTMRSMQGSVYGVDFSHVTGQIASGSKDRTIRLWQPTVYVPPQNLQCCCPPT